MAATGEGDMVRQEKVKAQNELLGKIDNIH